MYGAAKSYSVFGAYNPAAVAFSEAALVGGIADWFAVTALFRRPFSLPIPHTAIIPNSKERIGNALVSFLKENFIDEEKLKLFIRRSFLPSLLKKIEEPEVRAAVSLKLASFMRELSAYLRDNYDGLISQAIAPMVADIKISKVLELFLNFALTAERIELVSHSLKLLGGLLSTHEAELQRAVTDEMPWYIPKFMANRVYRDLIGGFRSRLEGEDGSRAVLLYLERLKSELATNEEFRRSVDSGWKKLIGGSKSEVVRGVWEEVFKALVADGDANVLATRIDKVLQGAGRMLSSSDVQQLEGGFFERFGVIVIRHFSEDGLAWILETFRDWDGALLSQKVEEKLGGDLQFVRINGTLVGGIVGLVLFSLFGQ